MKPGAHIDLPLPFRQECDIDMRQISEIEVEYGVSLEVRHDKTPTVTTYAQEQKFAEAIEFVTAGRVLSISRAKTGLINDLFFWQNDWKNKARVIVQLPKLIRLEATSGANVILNATQFHEVTINAKHGASVRVIENTSEKH